MVITPEEFKARMERIAEKLYAREDYFDQEMAHVEADGLMCEVLEQLGYSAGIDVFDSMPKWYA